MPDAYRDRDRARTRLSIYLKRESADYYRYIVVIRQNQLKISMHARSTTIADYSGINYLPQALVFLAKNGIISITSMSKNSKLNTF